MQMGRALMNICYWPILYRPFSIPDSKVHGGNMGPIWDRQDPGGPHAGPINLVIWDVTQWNYSGFTLLIFVPKSFDFINDMPYFQASNLLDNSHPENFSEHTEYIPVWYHHICRRDHDNIPGDVSHMYGKHGRQTVIWHHHVATTLCGSMSQ